MIIGMRESQCDLVAGDFDSLLIVFVGICSLYCYEYKGRGCDRGFVRNTTLA